MPTPTPFLDLHLHVSLTDTHGVSGPDAISQLLQHAQAQNVSTLLLTPHTSAYNPASSWQQDHSQTIAHCQAEAPHLTILSGCEFLIRHMEDILLVEQGLVPTLNQTKYILIEFLPDARSTLLIESAYELRLRGFIPLIAHPERYSTLQRSPEHVDQLLASGAHLQGTLTALLGLHGQRVRRVLWDMLKTNQISCLASDFHGGDYAALIARGTALLARQLGQPTVERLLSENPARILANEEL